MRVIAALSGGVDSAVAAARMVDAGHEVTGVHLALSRSSAVGGRERGCCTLDDARDARRAADLLGIPFYVWDLSERFAAEVIDDFVAEYAAGRTGHGRSRQLRATGDPVFEPSRTRQQSRRHPRHDRLQPHRRRLQHTRTRSGSCALLLCRLFLAPILLNLLQCRLLSPQLHFFQYLFSKPLP